MAGIEHSGEVMVSGRIAQATNRLRTGLMSIVTGASHQPRIIVLFFLAVPQIYIFPEGSRDVALTTIATLIIAPIVLLRARAIRFDPLLWLLVALLAVRISALAWSPEPRAGSQPVVMFAQFIILLLLARLALRQEGERNLLRLLERVYWPWVVAEASLVVLFRLLPGLEHLFHELLGGLLTGQNAIETLVPKGPNNVIDPAKSGGVFLNANVAAMFLGVNGLAALAFSRITGNRCVRWVGVAAIAAVPFTGSKSAIVLAFTLPAAAVAIYRLRHAPPAWFGRLWSVLAGFASAIVLLSIAGIIFGLLDTLAEALVGRTVIWGFGVSAFLDHPVLGLGYGGWEAGFTSYAAEHGADRVDFPPHNLLLSAWANTGLFGLALTLAFIVVVIRYAARAVAGSSGSGLKFVTFCAMAVTWVLIQGLGENTDLFGETHMLPMVALLLAFLSRSAGEGMEYRGRHIRRRDSQASAVPPFGDLHSQPGAGDALLPPTIRRPGPRSGEPWDRIG